MKNQKFSFVLSMQFMENRYFENKTKNLWH